MASPKLRICNNCGKSHKGYGKKYCSNFCSHQANPTAHLGHHHTKKVKEIIKQVRLGKKLSEKTKEKMKLSAHRGEDNPAKRPEIKEKIGLGVRKFYDKKGRKPPRGKHEGAEYIKWRLNVFQRDNFTCQGCNQVGGYLEVHHIKSWAKFLELRLDINNGITLCKPCHKLTNNYGYKKGN